MTLDLNHLKKLADVAEFRCCWCRNCAPDYFDMLSPVNVRELIQLAEKGKACEKRASESHLVGGVPGNHNW